LKTNWSRLDNAAKIFPSAVSKTDTHVFRISCELKEEVNPAILQKALNETMKIFKLYHYVLKRGFFWYYLEETDLMPLVEEETQLCGPIYDKNRKKLMVEVTYYHNRVNLEVYHVLSDGTGAVAFLRVLVTKYLSAFYKINEPALDFDASDMQMRDDSFDRYYDTGVKIKNNQRYACQLKGIKYPENRLKAISGVVSVKEMLRAAHQYNTTLSVFLSACLLDAISKNISLRQKKKPVVLSVPVNLRNHFPSKSARNFFSILYIEYDFCENNVPLEAIIKKVNEAFKEKLTLENLSQYLNTYLAVEHNVFARIVPLPIKDLCLKAAYRNSTKKTTAALSNVGIINMPKQLEEYIRCFHIMAGTSSLQVCIASFGDSLSVSFTSPFIDTDIQRCFFRRLTDMGIGVELTTNTMDDE